MEHAGNTIPGYRLYEYVLALCPHEELQARIIKVKEEFARKYKTEKGGNGGTYITLVTFTQLAMMEERLVNRLRVVAMAQPAFKVELKGYGSFPSHTIYINVATKAPLQNLVKTIRREAQRLMKLRAGYGTSHYDSKPHFILEPHISIARKLNPGQYELSWLEYSQKQFTGRFIANCMLLMKRPVEVAKGRQMKFQVVQKFEFQNMPVRTIQGELFN